MTAGFIVAARLKPAVYDRRYSQNSRIHDSLQSRANAFG
jgi:hypothetical protein